MVWSTVHAASADALFAASQQRHMRMITGKVLMDRNCPDFLRDTAESGARESADLISKWHNVDRLAYAITPRFAPTSTEAQLEACGELAKAHSDVFIQTHVAENRDEVKWVAELFPDARSYLDVYDRYNLCARARSTATRSTSTRMTAAVWPTAARPWRTAPRRTCSWAAASTTSTSRMRIA
jgi:guanine deaminase